MCDVCAAYGDRVAVGFDVDMLVLLMNPVGASEIAPGECPWGQPIHNTLLREGPSQSVLGNSANSNLLDYIFLIF